MMLEIMPRNFFVSTELPPRFTGIHVRSFFANKKEKRREDVNHRDTEAQRRKEMQEVVRVAKRLGKPDRV